ncbi:MAG: hypothetical protein JWP69_2067 [Flaviaesturariibacter sp.]|nr:hypothetical protein [Flaviaesturariibacter sp.]
MTSIQFETIVNRKTYVKGFIQYYLRSFPFYFQLILFFSFLAYRFIYFPNEAFNTSVFAFILLLGSYLGFSKKLTVQESYFKHPDIVQHIKWQIDEDKICLQFGDTDVSSIYNIKKLRRVIDTREWIFVVVEERLLLSLPKKCLLPNQVNTVLQLLKKQ